MRTGVPSVAHAAVRVPEGSRGPAGSGGCDPEVLVVGGGHNGLACAAYLARAGIDVQVVERRSTVGGCAASESALGTTVNLCNCDHTMVRASGIVEELDLAGHGLRYVDLAPIRHHLVTGADGVDRCWSSYHDLERTLDGLARSHPAQLAGYRRYLADTMAAAELVVAMTGRVPRPGAMAAELARRGGRGAITLMALGRATLTAAMARWFDDEDLVAPAAATGPAVWGMAPDAPGTGLAALGYALTHVVQSGRPVGGSGALTDALGRALAAAGGRVRCEAEVVSIDCEGDGVAGITLAGGERVRAPVVVSASDPRQTLVCWLRHPPTAARYLVGKWARRPPVDGYEAKIDAVVSERPRFRVDGTIGATGSTVVVTPQLAGILAAQRAARGGRVAPSPVMMGNVPDLCDPTVAPSGGGHTFSLEVLFTPYRLRGGWASSVEPQRWLASLAEHTTGDFSSQILRWRVRTPEDYERDLGLIRGHAPSYAGGPLAALLGRDRALSRYRTPVRGLYLTGAGTFPGAGVWGASGRNTASVVLADHHRRAVP